MERPHLSAVWLALLALALTATGAPLPFPRSRPDLALTIIRGEWAIHCFEDDGFVLETGRRPQPSLTATVRGDRISVFLDGDPVREWAVSSRASSTEGRLDLRLTSATKGPADTRGSYHKDALKLYLGAEDIGLDCWFNYTGRNSARLWVVLRRKAP